MAAMQNMALFALAYLCLGVIGFASAATFTLHNSCNHTIWPGTLSGNGGALLGEGGFQLTPGSTVDLPAPAGWSGRFWGRTDCNFDESGVGTCSSGDCGGGLKCIGGGVPPVTLVEFTIAPDSSQLDFYDVSLVDGYNVGMGVRASGGSGQCQYAGCVDDLNASCPPELQVRSPDQSKVVACKSACAAFNTPEYCCSGDHNTPATCSPTDYSRLFKQSCPSAYSYAYDDASSTCTCAGSSYVITFCPHN